MVPEGVGGLTWFLGFDAIGKPEQVMFHLGILYLSIAEPGVVG